MCHPWTIVFYFRASGRYLVEFGLRRPSSIMARSHEILVKFHENSRRSREMRFIFLKYYTPCRESPVASHINCRLCCEILLRTRICLAYARKCGCCREIFTWKRCFRKPPFEKCCHFAMPLLSSWGRFVRKVAKLHVFSRINMLVLQGTLLVLRDFITNFSFVGRVLLFCEISRPIRKILSRDETVRILFGEDSCWFHGTILFRHS